MPAVTQPGIVGTRQDLSDLIYLTQAEDNPVFAMLPKGGPANAEIIQHQADVPGRASKRGVRDGTPLTATRPQSARKLIEANSQWIREGVGVGKKAQAINEVAGVNDLYANEVAKALLALSRSVEELLCDDVDQRDEGPQGSELRGLGSWIATGAQANRPVPAEFRPAAAQVITDNAANITERKIRELLAAIFKRRNQSGRYVMVAGIDLKMLISDFAIYQPDKASNTVVRTFDGKAGNALRTTIDVIEGDAGTVEIMPSNRLAWDRDSGDSETQPEITAKSAFRGYVLEPGAFMLRVTQGVQHMEMPPDGGGRRGQVDAILALTGTPFGCGKIAPADKT